MKKILLTTSSSQNMIFEDIDDPVQFLSVSLRQDILKEATSIQILDLDTDQDITPQYALQICILKRVSDYPTPADFLNAFFDGGQAALDELQAKRLAIKAKYPKP